MVGNLLQLARRDAKRHVTNGGFETNIIVSNPLGDKVANICGWGTLHHIQYDPDGLPINGKNAHITIDEDQLLKLDFPVRINGEVNLKGCRVSYADSTGTIRKYIVTENFPDETLGLIECILGDFDDGQYC